MRNMISWQEKYCSRAFPAKESDRCRSRTGGGDRPLPPSLPPSPVMKPYLEQASKICNRTAQVFVSKREKCICLRLSWYFSSSSRVRMYLISTTNLTSNNNATYLAVEQFDNFPFWYNRAVLICRNYRLCTFPFVETSFIIRGKLSWYPKAAGLDQTSCDIIASVHQYRKFVGGNHNIDCVHDGFDLRP